MFDISILKTLSGSATYQRGEKLFALAAVQIIACSEKKVSAKVKGTQVYDVSLINSADNILGRCSCPAFANSGFCKHCVAVALTVNHHELVDSGVKVVSDEQKLQDYLESLDKNKLVEALFKQIFSDSQLSKQWLLRADMANKPVAEKELKKLITKALPKRQMWEYHKVARYFDNAEGVLDILLSQLDNVSADMRLSLMMQCLARLNVVLERIDDSGGYRFAVEGKIAQEIYAAFAAVSWSANEQARWLFVQYQNADDISLNIPDGFRLSAEVKSLFVAECQQAFDEYSVATDIKSRSWDHQLSRLSAPLLQFSKENNDLHQQVKILSKTADKLSDILKICELCLSYDDELSAEDWLLKAKALISNDHDQLIWQRLAVAVALANDDMRLAWRYALKNFSLYPCFTGYLALKTVAEQTGNLSSKIEGDVEQTLLSLYQEKAAGITIYADDVLSYYIHHQQFDKAIEWCESHKAHVPALLSFSESIAESHPDKAMLFYQRSLMSLLHRANNHTYAEVTEHLIVLSKKWPYGSDKQQYFMELLSGIIGKHKAKRNFMALVKDNFTDYLSNRS